MNNFSDFADSSGPLEGEKLKLDEVTNKQMIVTGFKISESKYGNGDGRYITIQFKWSESADPMVVFSGSKVLREQCEIYRDMMPFLATIKKVNQYYTFT